MLLMVQMIAPLLVGIPVLLLIANYWANQDERENAEPLRSVQENVHRVPR